jgi:hypothetical protein
MDICRKKFARELQKRISSAVITLLTQDEFDTN